MRYLSIFISLLALASFSLATTIHVPTDQPTIQAGVNAADDGDTVLIADGLYMGSGNRDIDLSWKNIVIRSVNGPDQTIIDCQGSQNVPHRAFRISDYSTAPTVIGITIRNGYGALEETESPVYYSIGGAVLIRDDASPTFVDCVFESNTANWSGGAVYCDGASPVFIGCRFINNASNYVGGAITTRANTSLSLSSCSFTSNYATHGGALRCDGASGVGVIQCTFDSNGAAIYGGAISLDNGAHLASFNSSFNTNRAGRHGGAIYCQTGSIVMDHLLFVSNVAADWGGAIYCGDRAGLEVMNCTLAGNSASGGSGLCYEGKDATVSHSIISFGRTSPACSGDSIYLMCCDIFGNSGGDWVGEIEMYADINGNMSINPLFCDAAANNYEIYEGSRCAPENNACSTLIGAFGVGCQGILSVNGFGVPGETLTNLLVHTPLFSWAYFCPVGNPEDSFEIAVGTNADWTHAEMWNPEAFVGPDTSITYAGLPLVDGATYYLRLRVHNGLAWSEWYNTSFRMNSIPAVPVHKSPGNNAIVTTTTPALYLLNSGDPESDPLFYDYEVINDSEYVVASVAGIAQQPDSSGWTIDITLGENRWYRWRARAFDGYEYSAWTVPTSFYVNSSEEPPSAFALTFPLGELPVYDKPVELLWGASFDPDPLDSVRYKLLIALDANFTFVATYDNIYQPHYPLGNLEYGTHYWWKVQAFDTKGNMTPGTNSADFWTWLLGDANADRSVNVGDAVFIINFVFKAGTAPAPLKIGDVNADCTVNVGDAVAVINYIFKEGDPPGVGCAE